MSVQFYGSGDYKRVVDIPQSGTAEPYRSDFRRDYARILHCPAFRRLQRKTQLFPGDESDFFRNRLTHSLEVAQIAKSIAIRLNYQIRQQYGETAGQIDLDLVELAGLAHDLGHPPFGHTGEHALHGRMASTGGFEGNAQTLRILAKLEKRQTLAKGGSGTAPDFTEFADGRDLRVGLNLCYRSLAAILKYDHCIPYHGNNSLVKGYYESEEVLVENIKRAVLADKYDARCDDKFRVIEMQIMDLADDIAYSTYDFEDALKAGFASPLELLQQMNSNEKLRDAVGAKLFKTKYDREFPSKNASSEDIDRYKKIKIEMTDSIFQMLLSFFIEIDETITLSDRELFKSSDLAERLSVIGPIAVELQKLSEEISKNGYVRAQLTSDLVGRRLRTITIEVDHDVPALSQIKIPENVRFEIDVLKHLTYELHIKSPRLKLIEYRGKQIVSELFSCFSEDEHGDMLPHDWRERIAATSEFDKKEAIRARLICDFIAGMTDAYALDVYSRLKTTNPAALFRPI